MLHTHAGAVELEPLPRVKISGTIQSAELRQRQLLHPNTPTIPGTTHNFETWLLGTSFITRVTGTRPHFEQIKEPHRIGNVTISDGSHSKRHDVPYTFVIAYQPDDLTSSSDFPVQYFEAPLDKNSGPRLNSMEDVSAEGNPWYAWWPLQRAQLAAQGLPTGTTSSVATISGATVSNYYLPPKFWDKEHLGQEHFRCFSSADKMVIQQISRGWFRGRAEPEMLVQQTTYSQFDPRWSNLPLRAETGIYMTKLEEIQGPLGTSVAQMICEIAHVEEVPAAAEFDDLLKAAAKGLPRIFRHSPRHADQPLTSTLLTGFDGKAIPMAGHANKFVLLHFWISWAQDNEKRFREIEKIVAEHASDPLFTALSINFDSDREAAQKVIKKIKPAWPQAYAGSDPAAARRFPFETLPAAVLHEPPRKESLTDPGLRYSGQSPLFGRYETSSEEPPSLADTVRESIALEKRRNLVGGVFAEMIGEASRAALKNARGAEAYLLMGNRDEIGFERKIDIVVPDHAEMLNHLPILYRWPDLSASIAREVAALLLRNDSYYSINIKDESYRSPLKEERLYGLGFRQGKSRLAVVYQSPKVEFNMIKDDDAAYYSSHQLILTDEANRKLQSILDKHLPKDSAMKAAEDKKLAEWARLEQRRRQDTVTSESVTPPVKVSAIWQGRGAIQFEWENPEGQPILIIRSDKREFTAIPDHDSAYKVGNAVGDAAVVYSGNGTSYVDQKLRNGWYYYYKIYARGNRGYSSTNVLRLSPGDGLRSMRAETFSEFQTANPGIDKDENDSYGDTGLIMHASSYLARVVSNPGQKQIEYGSGHQTFMLEEDFHPPVGGAGTYTTRLFLGADQQMHQIEPGQRANELYADPTELP